MKEVKIREDMRTNQTTETSHLKTQLAHSSGKKTEPFVICRIRKQNHRGLIFSRQKMWRTHFVLWRIRHFIFVSVIVITWPGILKVSNLAAKKGTTHVVVCLMGFVCCLSRHLPRNFCASTKVTFVAGHHLLFRQGVPGDELAGS